MRRAQTDKGSQPVRNLAGNPAFNYASGVQTVRTNRCLNPSFELSSGLQPVRTNLCINPRGINGWGGYGVQTITTNVAITGNPDGITTATRVAYTSTDNNPGIAILNPATSGTNYTMSAWIYHETIPTAGSQGFAEAGAAAMASPPAFVQGVWQRISWTRTSTGSFFGYRVSGQNAAGSFLITGILVEAAPDLSNFFDGATTAGGDFTYAWSGTANASTSVQRSPNAQYWTSATNAVAYQSTTTTPVVGSECGAVQTKGSNGDGTYVSDIAVVAGTSYTASIWVQLTSTVPSFSGVLRWKDSGQAILSDGGANVVATLVVGSWVRVSVSGVAPTGAVWLQAMWRIYAAHTPTTFYLDGSLVEDTPALGTYFDGTTAAAGDYTYLWSGGGAAHMNWSLQRTSLIPHTVASRNSSVLDAKFFAWQGTAEDGKKTLKFVSPAGTANSGWRVAQISGASTQGWDVSKVKAGGRYTLWMRYRTSGWGAGQTAFFQIADGNNLNTVIGNDTAIPLNATGWVEYRRTFTTVRDATTNSQIYMALPATPQTATDGVLEIREWGLYEGEYTGDYVDGTKPFSKWDGTANQSSSIGYPQQLLDIAGKPSADITGVGSTGFVTVSALSARTIYFCYEVLDTSANYNSAFNYGITGTGGKGLNFQTGPTGSLTMNPRADFPGGDANSAPSITNGRVPGRRHVIGVSFPQGLATGAFRLNGTEWSGTRFYTNVGTGWDEGRVSTLVAGGVIPLRALVYYAEHDDATKLAMAKYLGNKYGALIA